MKWGNKQMRLGKDHIRNFDSCGLCLVRATDPLCSPSGIIYCKECIYANLLEQKKKFKKKMAAWEAEQRKQIEAGFDEAHRKEQEKLEAFYRVETGIVSNLKDKAERHRVLLKDDDIGATVTAERQTAAQHNISLDKELGCFWVPQLTPTSDKSAALKRPQNTCYDPIANKPIRLKQLVHVKFKRIPQKTKSAGVEGFYMCPITRKSLTNATKVCVLRRCGHALLLGDYVIKALKSGKRCPVCEVQCKKKDIILLERATGFTASGQQMMSKHKGAVFVM